MKYKMTIPLAILLSILCQTIPTSSFLLKCETVVEEIVNGTHNQESVGTPAVDASATITTYEDYIITSHGIHKIHKRAETWNSARNICLDEKAQLAVIDTAAEEALLIKYMKDNNIRDMWIGVHDLFEKNQWTTVTGERIYSLDYVHWTKNEPNNFDWSKNQPTIVGSGEHCVNLSLTGMNDLLCTFQIYFVCEKMKMV